MYLSEKEPLLKHSQEIAEEDEISATNSQFFPSLNIFQSCIPNLGQIFPKKQPINYEYPEDTEELPELPYLEPVTANSRYTIENKLVQLRKLMRQNNIGTYIIPSSDEHQSEYTSLFDKRREYISGFTGSAGVVIVTLNNPSELSGEAILSTDGRYFLQAETELDLKIWKILKQGMKNELPWTKYIVNQALTNPFSNVISCDSKLINLEIGQFFKIQSQYLNIRFKPELNNLIDLIWESDNHPLRSLEPIYEYSLKYSGVDTNEKLKSVRKIMDEKHKSDTYVVTELDSIAWLFNLRADYDVPFTPVFFAYSIITHDSVILFIDEHKLTKEVNHFLSMVDNLSIQDYKQFYPYLRKLRSRSIILPAKSSTNFALYNIIKDSYRNESIKHDSIISNLKIFKNKVELSNARIAQYKDSFAFIIFISWLDDQLAKGKNINEYQAACKIFSIRSKLPNFKGLSYETISSTGSNAAIIHYAPTKHINKVIDPNEIYLIDSGCHFLEGTTDITRTFKFGADPKLEYKKYYTLVLKGHLSVAMAKFPPHSKNTGTVLDAYARQPLWNQGLDFNHGTGHGVGQFGTIHEGPLFISTTTSTGESEIDLFQPGGIVTDEPGFYINGEVGFRVESELEIIEIENNFGKTKNGDNFLGFNYMTKIPFCRKLIDLTYLSQVEINWINQYHENIRVDFGEKLLELGDKRAYNWLVNETKPL